MMRPQVGAGFHGLPTLAVESTSLRLEFLADTGPRIVRLSLAGSNENLLAEVPEFSWETPHGTYFPRGGHRLWLAPESASRSSVPEGRDLVVEDTADGIRLTQPAESCTLVSKSIEIRLAQDRPKVTLAHRVSNGGTAPVEIAPWAITMLPPGGVVLLPLQAPPVDADRLQPNRFLALWPYTRWDDPRLRFSGDHLLVDVPPGGEAAKVGAFSRAGWVGYVRKNVLFCKQFTPQPGRPHTDLGCNVEIYLHPTFVELETLGPLVVLEPGQAAHHDEAWEVYPLPLGPDAPEEIREALEAIASSRHA